MADDDVITTQVSIRRWILGDEVAMLAALQAMAGLGYYGTLRVAPREGNTVGWDLEVVDANRNTISGQAGQVMVLMGSRLETMSQQDFDQTFPDASNGA